jgi:hypothetical protein
MKVREFERVFGGEPTPLMTYETVIDIGSGYSDLGGLDVAQVVQIDPVYAGAATTPNGAAQFGFAVGQNTPPVRELVSTLSEANAHRVTMANTYRYIPRDERLTALQQMLQLAHSGILQIYPIMNRYAEKVTVDAARHGARVIVQSGGHLGLRQAVMGVARSNNTLTVLEQQHKAGPADRKRLATTIAEYLL